MRRLRRLLPYLVLSVAPASAACGSVAANRPSIEDVEGVDVEMRRPRSGDRIFIDRQFAADRSDLTTHSRTESLASQGARL